MFNLKTQLNMVTQSLCSCIRLNTYGPDSKNFVVVSKLFFFGYNGLCQSLNPISNKNRHEKNQVFEIEEKKNRLKVAILIHL